MSPQVDPAKHSCGLDARGDAETLQYAARDMTYPTIHQPILPILLDPATSVVRLRKAALGSGEGPVQKPVNIPICHHLPTPPSRRHRARRACCKSRRRTRTAPKAVEALYKPLSVSTLMVPYRPSIIVAYHQPNPTPHPTNQTPTSNATMSPWYVTSLPISSTAHPRSAGERLVRA